MMRIDHLDKNVFYMASALFTLRCYVSLFRGLKWAEAEMGMDVSKGYTA